MNGIQILLIAGIAILVLYYVARFRNAVFDILVVLIFAGLGIFFILFPEKTNLIAHKLGVGRGADLLFYSCIIFFLFVVLKLFARLRRLEEKLTELIRSDAKKNAKEPGEDNPG